MILVALAVGQRVLPEYAQRFNLKVFTQPQLFACLACMAFRRIDYRGVEEHFRDGPLWRELIGLMRVPDHATLHRALSACSPPAARVPILDLSTWPVFLPQRSTIYCGGHGGKWKQNGLDNRGA